MNNYLQNKLKTTVVNKMTKKNFIEATIIKSNDSIDLDLPPISYDELPSVSILTLTYQRSHFFQLMWNCWNSYKYPKEKLEWVIVDDSPGTEHDLTNIIPNYPNIHYIKLPNHMSVGDKRNFGVKNCSFDLIAHQDDDDYYFPDSILAKVRTLKRYPKCGCVFSNNLSAYNILNNISYVMDPKISESCLSLPEATLMFRRSFWEQQPFPNDHFGEGKGFAINREKKFVSIPCIFNMISLTHSRNMTGMARNVETKSIKTNAKLANYFDLFDGLTKNIIKKLAKLTNKELAVTKYDRIFIYNIPGEEIECDDNSCTVKTLGVEEFEMLMSIPNYHRLDNIEDFNNIQSTITDNDLILVAWYGNTDLRNLGHNQNSDSTISYCDTLPPLAKDLLKHNRSKLLIYNSWECRNFLDPYKKGELCIYCSDHLNIDPSRVIVATTDFLNPLVHSLAPQIIGYDFPYLYAKSKLSSTPLPSIHSTKSNTIIMLNRRGSIERTACALFLYTHFRSSCHLSYLTQDEYSPTDLNKYGVNCSAYNDFKKSLPLMINPPKKIELDQVASSVWSKPIAHVDWTRQDDIADAIQQSAIMLTMETNLEGPTSYVQQVSEKTYKAISHQMPFIIFTSKPGILKHLRSLGFKTFHPHIDESYDYPTIQHKTEDHNELLAEYHKRFRKLLKELNRLCQMSSEERQQFCSDCQQIVQHNIKLLSSKDPTSIKTLPIIEK